MGNLVKNKKVNGLKLVLPSKKYENSYYSLIRSAQEDNSISELGNARCRDNESFDQMLKRLRNRRKGINLARRDVPATVYWMIVNDNIVGTIDLRHYLNEDYYKRLGHLAYYIKKEERNKGYATEALNKAKKIYQKHNVDQILVTCLKDNLYSSKVIKTNGGKLKNEVLDKKSNQIIQRWIIKIFDKKVIPNVAWLTTNRTCNNNCVWCYTGKYRVHSMDFNKAKQYIDSLSTLKIKKIILIGGEPTIYENILEIIKYISEKNIEVSIATNGRIFSNYEFAKNAVKNGLKNCNISIKGATEEEYLKNTRSYGFIEMVKGYHNLKQLGINVSTSYVLCDKDYDKFDKFLESLQNNKLDNIVFQLYKPSVDVKDDYNAPTIKDLAEICKYVYYKIKETKLRFKFEMSIPLCSLDKDLLQSMIKDNCITTCCHISKGNGIIFDTNFDLLPCNHFVGHPLNSNNIMSYEIESFWNSDVPVEFRKELEPILQQYVKNVLFGENVVEDVF